MVAASVVGVAGQCHDGADRPPDTAAKDVDVDVAAQVGSLGCGRELGAERATGAAAMAALLAADRSAEADHMAGVEIGVGVAPGVVASAQALSAADRTAAAAPAEDGDASAVGADGTMAARVLAATSRGIYSRRWSARFFVEERFPSP